MSEYQKYLDCEHEWNEVLFQLTECDKCGVRLLDWGYILEIATLEAQQDDLLAACELAKGSLLGICVTHPHLCCTITIEILKAAIARVKGEGNNESNDT